jgi:hypothetical protein
VSTKPACSWWCCADAKALRSCTRRCTTPASPRVRCCSLQHPPKHNLHSECYQVVLACCAAMKSHMLAVRLSSCLQASWCGVLQGPS